MLGIDTCEEWALVMLELSVLILIAVMGLSAACGMFVWYLAQTVWYWDLKYFMERI